MRPLCIFVVATASLLFGCVSVVTVKKADGNAEGIRYFLPEVFIQVTPAADGTIAVEKLYLPDPSHEYSISARSFLSAHTLEVERDEKGLLKSVIFNSDSTGVAQQLATSAAAVRAAEIDARTVKAKADSDQAKADVEKAKAALETADSARKTAAAALDAAQRKVDLLEHLDAPLPSDIAAQILAARLAVVEAQAKKDAADAAYNELLSNAKAPDTNAANGGKKKEDSWPKAMEPVFYRVLMDADKVTLKQAFAQSARATWVAPKTDATPGQAIFPASIVVRPAAKSGALSKPVHLIVAAKAVAVASFTSEGKAFGILPVLSLQQDQKTIDIEIPKTYESGDYELDLLVTPAQPDGATAEKRLVKIRIER